MQENPGKDRPQEVLKLEKRRRLWNVIKFKYAGTERKSKTCMKNITKGVPQMYYVCGKVVQNIINQLKITQNYDEIKTCSFY